MSITEWQQQLLELALDRHDGLSDRSLGKDIADPVLARLKELGITLPPDAKYLAIGAGQAWAEIELARLLGIRPENVTLLDKKFSPHARRRFQDMPFIGELVEEDVFQFLGSVQTRKFDVVSAIGVEYAYNTGDKLERLIGGLSTHMNGDGVAILVPCVKRTHVNRAWTRYGFFSLGESFDANPGVYGMVLKSPAGSKNKQ